MRRHLLRITIVAVLICGSSVAFARLNGPPKGVTGARPVGNRLAEPNCQYCHDPSNPLNDPSGQLEIVGLPETFDVNTDYPVTVRLSHTWNPVPPDPLNWGFQMTAVRADSGTGYGTFTPGIDNKIATTTIPGVDPTRTYIEQNSSGTHNGETGPVEWSFTWRSPGYIASKVLFFAAGNAADGATTSSGDWIYTTSDSMTFGLVGVDDGGGVRTELSRPWPNPAPGRTELRYALAASARVDLVILDLQGRRVRALVAGDRPAGRASVTWDGRDDAGIRVPNGLYFATLAIPGETPRAQKIALSR